MKATAEKTWRSAISRGEPSAGKPYSIFSSEKESLLVLLRNSSSVNNLPKIELVTAIERNALFPADEICTEFHQHCNTLETILLSTT